MDNCEARINNKDNIIAKDSPLAATLAHFAPFHTTEHWPVKQEVSGSNPGGGKLRKKLVVRGSDEIYKYLPYFSSYLMLIMREFVVSVCIN